MLSAQQVKTAKPKERQYKLHDGNGLFIIIRPNGSKWWRFRYKLRGKTKEISLGTYPDKGLKAVRLQRDEYRLMLSKGIDPSAARQATKGQEGNENSFEAIATEWHTRLKDQWTPSYAARIWRRLEKDVLPYLGSIAIASLKPMDILGTVRRIEDRGTLETAHRTLSTINQVLRYGVQTGRIESNPARELGSALLPAKTKHHAALVDPKDVGALLRAIDGYNGDIFTQAALKLAPLVFVRPGELRHMLKEEVDLSNKIWEIPAEKMKMRQAHLVPLSRQAIEVLEQVWPLTPADGFVFPSVRSRTRPMSENTINAALRRLGYTKDEMTGHGFRAMARTLLDEQLHFAPHLIEHQLAHAVRDPLGRAYNRTQHLAERTAMMQAWADYLDRLRLS